MGFKKGKYPSNGAFQNSKFLSWKNEVFQISKYKRKINFDPSLRVPKWGLPPETGRQNSNFLTTDARQMKFSV